MVKYFKLSAEFTITRVRHSQANSYMAIAIAIF